MVADCCDKFDLICLIASQFAVKNEGNPAAKAIDLVESVNREMESRARRLDADRAKEAERLDRIEADEAAAEDARLAAQKKAEDLANEADPVTA